MGNHFDQIGSDGVAIGDTSRDNGNIVVSGNTFLGGESYGENGIDIKGSVGPIYVHNNLFQGFRPCKSGQDCSGSNGPGITAHCGARSGHYQNLVIDGNRFINNTIGLIVTTSIPSLAKTNIRASNITVKNNTFQNNKSVGLIVSDVNTIDISANAFQNNPTHVLIQQGVSGCTQSGNAPSGLTWGSCK